MIVCATPIANVVLPNSRSLPTATSQAYHTNAIQKKFHEIRRCADPGATGHQHRPQDTGNNAENEPREVIRRADELGVSLVIGSDHDTRTLSDLLHIVSGARNDLIKPLPAAGDGREQ